MQKKNDEEGARKIFECIYPENEVEAQLTIVRTSSVQKHSTVESLFSSKYRVPLMLAFAIAFFNQVSGINALLYYARRIFSEAGLGDDAVFLSTVGVGIANFIFTIIGVLIIDRVGRKKLMYIGSFGYIITLATTSLALSAVPMQCPKWAFELLTQG